MRIFDKPQPQEDMIYYHTDKSRGPLIKKLKTLLRKPYPRSKLIKLYGERQVMEAVGSLDIRQTRIDGKLHWQWFNPKLEPKKLVFKPLSDV